MFRKTALAAMITATVPFALAQAGDRDDHGFPGEHRVRHVLLISVDGLHAIDVENYIHTHPASALARLTRHGVRYTNAASAKPSDSFPGLLAMVTGGSPVSTGVYYDDSYDRTFYPPGTTDCRATPGAEVVFDESIDNATSDGIDPAKLPVGPNCKVVYPHQFLRANTIFEVVKAHRGRTAWADKHPAYELVNGPSGTGVDDLYTPEITVVDGANATSSVVTTAANDALKVQAILNEIHGLDHTGTKKARVPAVFGMNFQAVSVGQKLARDSVTGLPGGYLDAAGTPSTVLQYGLDKTDAALGKMIKALRDESIFDRTLLIVSAKHGQAPIDPAKVNKAGKLSAKLAGVASVAGAIAQVTEDDVALIWLKDQSQTQAVVDVLHANQAAWNIDRVLSGASLTLRFPDPAADSRAPDIVVLPTLGTIFTASGKKNAEHGGFTDDDTNVALVVSHPGMREHVVKTPATTMQIGPTIVQALGIDPDELDAVRIEHTTVLPGLNGASDRR